MGRAISHLLFARPSFLEGIARILDFGNTLTEYNRCPTPELADYLALRADWQVTGNDLRQAIAQAERSLLKEGR